MTELETRALGILRGYEDAVCYEQMIQSIAHGEAEVLSAQAEGILLHHTHEGFYMLAGDAAHMRDLARQIPADAQDVLLHGELDAAYVEDMRTKLGLADVEPYWIYAYYGELPPEETEVEIRPLSLCDAEFVTENYGHASREYIEYLLNKGVMIGAYRDGQLAGFIGEHAAGAMGLLHVMPAFRRHHLGYALERADIRRVMLDGYTPFGQVALDNVASQRLQEKLGLIRSKGKLYWMSR